MIPRGQEQREQLRDRQQDYPGPIAFENQVDCLTQMTVDIRVGSVEVVKILLNHPEQMKSMYAQLLDCSQDR